MNSIEWLRSLAEKGGKGVVDNVDARALGRVADELEQFRKADAGCRWYWPEDDTSSEFCETSWQDVLEHCDCTNGDVMTVSRGGVVEIMYCAMLPPAEDSESDDWFEVCEPTEELAKAAVEAEVKRRSGEDT